MKKILAVATCAALSFGLIGCASGSSGSSSASEPASSSSEAVSASASVVESSDPEFTMKYGELVDSNVTVDPEDGYKTLVVEARIQPVTSRDLTLNYNYMNLADLIQNQGADQYDEIQYWAVVDSGSGDEKIISFTATPWMIEKIAKDELSTGLIAEYANDLWIAPAYQ